MPAVTKLDRQALQVARLLSTEGFVVRRDVQLAPQLEVPATSLDLLAVRVDPGLQVSTAIVGCVTAGGRNPRSPADKILWLAGARELLGAERVVMTTGKTATTQLRSLAERLRVDLISAEDLERRERAAGLHGAPPSGPADERMILRQDQVGRDVGKDDELARVWRFVGSESWFLDDVVVVKRALGALRLLARRYEAHGDPRPAKPIAWLAHQAQLCLVFALVRTAGRALRTPPHAFTQTFVEQLSEGIASFAALREISRQVDRFLMAVLSRAETPPAQAAESLGVFDPQPPSYAEPLVELLERLAGEPLVAASMPRTLDWRIASVELGEEPQHPQGVPSNDGVGRQLRLVAAFLRGQLGVPEPLLEPLLVAAPTDHPRGKILSAPPESSAGAPSEQPLFTSASTREEPADMRVPVGAEAEPDDPAGPPQSSLNVLPPPPEDATPAPPPRSQDTTSRSRRRRNSALPSRDPDANAVSRTPQHLVPGHDEHHAVSAVDTGGDAGQRMLLVAVRNKGTIARRVVAASAQAEQQGELIAKVPAVVRAGQETQLELSFSAPSRGLADGERVTLELTDDEGRRHHLALRHVSDGRLRAEAPPKP
jgi:hypothetical protein